MTASCAAAEPLPADVRQLLEARLPAVAGDVRWHARSDTLLDTGSWVARTAVHAAVCGDRFVLIAAGPRPLVLDLPIAALSSAVYNHVTGELSFPHASAVPAVPPVRLDPLVARSLVARSLVALAPCPTPPTPSISPNLSSGTPSHA